MVAFSSGTDGRTQLHAVPLFLYFGGSIPGQPKLASTWGFLPGAEGFPLSVFERFQAIFPGMGLFGRDLAGSLPARQPSQPQALEIGRLGALPGPGTLRRPHPNNPLISALVFLMLVVANALR